MPVPLRPLSNNAVYDGAFEILKVRPAVLLGAAAVIVVPLQLAAMWVRGGPYRLDLWTWLVWVADEAQPLQEASDTRGGAVWASGALDVLATFLVGLVVARVVAGWYTGSDLGVGAALRQGLARPVHWAGAFVVMAIAQGLGMLLGCIGVILPVTWFCVLAPVLGVEQLGGWAAVRRSWSLGNRRFFAVLGVIIGMTTIDQLLRLALEALPWLLAGSLPEVAVPWVRTVLVLAVSVVSAVFIAAASVLVYFDVRVRTEGLDLELEATDAFARPS